MILSLLLAGMGTAATAQNINLPIIQTKYTADPAPYVHNDTVYLYTTHDEDGAEGFLMGVRKKLSNENFVAHAPEKVVALERKKESDSVEKIATLKATIEELKKK